MFGDTFVLVQPAEMSPNLRGSDRKRKFFQRKSTSNNSANSAPNSSTDSSVDHPTNNNCTGSFSLAFSARGRSISTGSGTISTAPSAYDSAVSRALEEALRTTAILGWDGLDSLDEPSSTANSSASSLVNIGITNKMQPNNNIVAKGVASTTSQSSPSTANSSPKGLKGKRSVGSLGLVRSRDGSHLSPNTQTYISLPSPNIQSAKSNDPLLDQPKYINEDEGLAEEGPDSASLVRRGALVPPKMDDAMDPLTDSGGNGGGSSGSGCCSGTEAHSTSGHKEGNVNVGNAGEGSSATLGSGQPQRGFPRRSSVVVIPPMQVCPGDLLVYSKALTHRGNFAELDGSTQSLANDADVAGSSSSARKGKNTWSLLKLFERDKKPKIGENSSSSGGQTGGLEEALAMLTNSEFTDEQLIRLCGLTWADFVELVEVERSGGTCTSWLSSSAKTTVLTPTVSESLALSSASTTQTVATSSEEEELGDNLTSPVTTVKTPAPNPVRRTRLKRAQSERAPSVEVVPSSVHRHSVYPESNVANDEDDGDRSPSGGGSPASYATEVFKKRGSKTVSGLIRSSLVHSNTFTAKDMDPGNRFLTGKETVSRNEAKRREAVWDLFQSETAFLLDHLMVLKHVYMEPLKKAQVEGFLMFAEPEVLFGNLDELCCVTHSFCKEFLQTMLYHMGADGDLAVPDVMRRLFEKGGKARLLSQANHRYALNYINALNYLESLRRQPDFCDFEKWCNRDLRCKKLQLTDLLVSPVHHIMKIPLVIRDIEARTDDPDEKQVIAKIHEMKENSLRELDDKMKWLKNFDRLLEIQRNIVWPSVLEMDPKQYYPEFLKAALSRQPCERLIVSPRRQILMEGTLLLLDSGKPTEMFVILFDDLLLITRRKKSLSKKKSSLGENWPGPGVRLASTTGSDVSMKYVVHKQPLSLDRFFIHEVASSEAALAKLDHAFILVCLNRFQQIVAVHTFQADTEQIKQNWLLKLREAQEMWKRTLQTTVFKGGDSDRHNCGDNSQSPTDKSVPNIL